MPDPAPVARPADTVDERSLFASWRAGDRAALSSLVEATYRDVYGALFKMTGGDVDLAADLTQETYRKAWQALPGFEGRAKFSTWLYRIAYTTFLKHVRRPRPLAPFDDGAPERLVDEAPDVEAAASGREEAERLRRAVLGLPDRLRFTVAARYWSGLPVAEIAVLESITTVAVRKRLRKACTVLRAALEEEVR